MNEKIELQVGVKVILKNQDGQFLILKRNPKKYPGVKEKWDIPGGRIEPSTPLIENLKREVKEETGLKIITNPKLLHAQDILRTDLHVVRLSYTAECEGNVELDESEHTEYKWLFLEEINKIEDLDPYAREAYAMFAAHFFPKLIRDKVPKQFKEKYGIETLNKKIADTEFYKHLLSKKLIEESVEVEKAHDEQNIKTELADVFEVISAILKTYKWTMDDIAEIQKAKRDLKGGFDERVYMEVPMNKE